MHFSKKSYLFLKFKASMTSYDVITDVFGKGNVTLPFLKEEPQNFVSCIILMCFPH